VIHLASRWTERWRRLFVAAGCLLVAVLLGVNMTFIPFDGPPLAPANPDDVCPSPATRDTHSAYKMTTKQVLEAVDLVVSVSLLYLIRKFQVGGRSLNLMQQN
jgi:hypothetical protein